MSVQALSCAMVIRGVSASEKLLLLVLANYADDRMTSWPSHKRMAADACLSERTILSVLKSLEVKRLISRKDRYRQDGSRTTDAITLHFSGEVTAPPPEAASPHGAADDTPPGKSTAPGGAQIAPLTTFDPSLEPSSEPLLGSQGSPPERKPRRRVPDDWVPAETTIARLRHEGFIPGDLERALTRMRDHLFRTAHTDWDAAFRNWVRKDRDMTRKAHDRPDHHSAKLDAKRANLAAAERGADSAARFRGVP